MLVKSFEITLNPFLVNMGDDKYANQQYPQKQHVGCQQKVHSQKQRRLPGVVSSFKSVFSIESILNDENQQTEPTFDALRSISKQTHVDESPSRTPSKTPCDDVLSDAQNNSAPQTQSVWPGMMPYGYPPAVGVWAPFSWPTGHQAELTEGRNVFMLQGEHLALL